MTTLWILGRIIEQWPVPDSETHARWKIDGVFDSEDKAVAQCSVEQQFIGPVELNAVLPETPWPGAYYPLITDEA